MIERALKSIKAFLTKRGLPVRFILLLDAALRFVGRIKCRRGIHDLEYADVPQGYPRSSKCKRIGCNFKHPGFLAPRIDSAITEEKKQENEQYLIRWRTEGPLFMISKAFEFSAAHALPHLPESHPCARLHGHNYVVIVKLRSYTLNGQEFVVDFKELDPIKTYIDGTLDHQNLNDILPINTTSENIAKYLFEVFSRLLTGNFLYSVTVCETSKTSAEYVKEIKADDQ